MPGITTYRTLTVCRGHALCLNSPPGPVKWVLLLSTPFYRWGNRDSERTPRQARDGVDPGTQNEYWSQAVSLARLNGGWSNLHLRGSGCVMPPFHRWAGEALESRVVWGGQGLQAR